MRLPTGKEVPAGQGRVHYRFRVDAQSLGDAIDLIEIGNHLHDVENVAVILAVV